MFYSVYTGAASNCGQVASMLYFEWNDLMKILSEISMTCKKLKTSFHRISLWFVCRTQPHQLPWPEVKAATAVASTLCGATSNEGVCSQRALDEWWQWTPACGRLIQWVLNVMELVSLTWLNTCFLNIFSCKLAWWDFLCSGPVFPSQGPRRPNANPPVIQRKSASMQLGLCEGA